LLNPTPSAIILGQYGEVPSGVTKSFAPYVGMALGYAAGTL
jgi:hypothetical protein